MLLLIFMRLLCDVSRLLPWSHFVKSVIYERLSLHTKYNSLFFYFYCNALHFCRIAHPACVGFRVANLNDFDALYSLGLD